LGGIQKMLKQELAEKLVKEVRKLIDEEVIVVGTDGIIIASTDRNRLNSFHEGAFRVSNNKQRLIITKEDESQLKGVKAGVNFPILFQNDVIGVIGITGEPEKVLPLGEITRKMTELYISESYYAEQFDWKSRAVEAFVFDWIQKKDWDSAFTDRAALLNMNLQTNRQIVMMELITPQPITREIWSSIQHALPFKRNDVMVRWGNEKIVLFLDIGVKDNQKSIKGRLKQFQEILMRNLKIEAFAGIGQVTHPSNVNLSYQQAERALKIAQKQHTIIFDSDLTLDMLLDDVNSHNKMEFLKRTIGTIVHEEELIETVQQLFLKNNSLKETAQALHIHINTLHYRLKKLEERTGLNLKNMKDFTTLYLAFYLLDEKTKNQLINLNSLYKTT
jgi:carbohydrate diacid regulator